VASYPMRAKNSTSARVRRKRLLLVNTSRYDTKLVRYIVRYAANCIDIGDVAINIKNSKHHYAGRAYPQIPPISPWIRKYPAPRYLIVCRIGKPEKFPYQSPGYPRRKIENGHWPTPLLADWQEALVFLVAHELLHIQQFRVGARCTEEETEAYGMRRLEAWRELVVADKIPALRALKDLPTAAPRKSKERVLAAKLAHAEKMLKMSKTKLKRAETLIKRWQKRMRYYQKQTEVASGSPGRHAETQACGDIEAGGVSP
jgi:hypothetical protein